MSTDREHETKKYLFFEIMPFTATWMQLGILILSKARERQIPYDITHMWNLKYNTNEPIYERETESQT